MSDDHTSLDRLVELLDERLRTSEWEILTALAAADEPMNYGALAEATGYTERTIKKRVGTLAEVVHGETLLRTEGDPRLHPQFAAAVRAYADADAAAAPGES
jgi:hypothetical protein